MSGRRASSRAGLKHLILARACSAPARTVPVFTLRACFQADRSLPSVSLRYGMITCGLPR